MRRYPLSYHDPLTWHVISGGYCFVWALEVALEMRFCERNEFWSRLKCSRCTFKKIVALKRGGHQQIVYRTDCRWCKTNSFLRTNCRCITMHLTSVYFALFQAERSYENRMCQFLITTLYMFSLYQTAGKRIAVDMSHWGDRKSFCRVCEPVRQLIHAGFIQRYHFLTVWKGTSEKVHAC